MKLQRKGFWLLAAPFLVIGSVVGVVAWSNHCSDSCYSSVGNFNSAAVGTPAALRQLSQQIKRCPAASLYTTHFDVFVNGVRMDAVSIKYEPSTSILVYDPNYSAAIQLWRNVKVQAVHGVAHSGNLANLKQYGCYRTR